MAATQNIAVIGTLESLIKSQYSVRPALIGQEVKKETYIFYNTSNIFLCFLLQNASTQPLQLDVEHIGDCSCIDTLNAELNPVCNLLPLLGARHIFDVSGLKVNPLEIK